MILWFWNCLCDVKSCIYKQKPQTPHLHERNFQTNLQIFTKPDILKYTDNYEHTLYYTTVPPPALPPYFVQMRQAMFTLCGCINRWHWYRGDNKYRELGATNSVYEHDCEQLHFIAGLERSSPKPENCRWVGNKFGSYSGGTSFKSRPIDTDCHFSWLSSAPPGIFRASN